MKRTTAEPKWALEFACANGRKVNLEREEIYRLLAEAKEALKPSQEDAATLNTIVTKDAHSQYVKDAKRIFGVDPNTNLIIYPQDANTIIDTVRLAGTKATLRKYARSVRHVALNTLSDQLKQADLAQRKGDWAKVENVISQPQFTAFTDLAKMMPADYSVDWVAPKPRRSKKLSLSRLPKDWRELMAAKSKGQFRIPMMIALISGVRLAELEKGVQVKLHDNCLYVHIESAKVKENAGQGSREFKLAKHPITNELIEILHSADKTEMAVKVKKGNSVTTHMRQLGGKIWPNRKESITCYSARHAMAADCKKAIFDGADPDLVSQVLGHIVDKTASYYGNRFQSGGISVVPSDIKVPKVIKHKSKERNQARRRAGHEKTGLTTVKPFSHNLKN